MYNDFATCEMMLESANGQINDQKEEEEEIKKPLDSKKELL